VRRHQQADVSRRHAARNFSRHTAPHTISHAATPPPSSRRRRGQLPPVSPLKTLSPLPFSAADMFAAGCRHAAEGCRHYLAANFAAAAFEGYHTPPYTWPPSLTCSLLP